MLTQKVSFAPTVITISEVEFHSSTAYLTTNFKKRIKCNFYISLELAAIAGLITKNKLNIEKKRSLSNYFAHLYHIYIKK